MKKWNYEHGLLQASGSLWKYFGLDKGHGSDPVIDAWLQKHQFRCVFAILIDGMGTEIVLPKLDGDAFFVQHMAERISTVYPPTTVAATSSFITGRSPKENGWLGWNQYFKEKDDEIILFYEKGQYSGIDYAGFVNQHIEVSKIYDALNEHGIKADSIWPGFSDVNPCHSYSEQLALLREMAKDKELRFVYTYWDAFDSLLHKVGPSHPLIQEELLHLNAQTEAFVKELPDDIGVLIIADHGQIDVGTCTDISKDAVLCDCLLHRPTIEARTMAFHIKDNKIDTFQTHFLETYGNDFELFTADEIKEMELFGPGVASPYFEEYIGDFIAISKNTNEISFGPRTVCGDHAGPTEAEEMIPVILYPQGEPHA